MQSVSQYDNKNNEFRLKSKSKMEVINHVKGRNIGRISILRTLATMGPGESWETSETEIDLLDARVLCSRYGRKTGRSFTVAAPMEAAPRIVITRTA